MDYRTIIKLFSERIGLDDFVPNDEELCVLVTEDGMRIEIQYFLEVNTILLSCGLLEVPLDAPLEFYRWLLVKNDQYLHDDGVTLSVEDETSILHLTQYIHLENTNDGLFHDSVVKFYSAVNEVMMEIKNHLKYNSPAEVLPQGADEESLFFPLNQMRV